MQPVSHIACAGWIERRIAVSPVFIKASDVDHLLSWAGVVEALYQGHQLQQPAAEDVYLERDSRGYFNRCAWIPTLGLATKTVTIFPDNRSQEPPLPSIQGALLLFEDDGGTLQSVIDGELVTKWKTTGDSMLGAKLLARPDSRRLLMVGAGTVAKYQIDAYTSLFPSLQQVFVWNRSAANARKLVSEFQDTHLDISVTQDLVAAAGQADIISCATMTTEPLLKGSWINPGTHVDLIGAFLPDMREADDELLQKASLYVDSRKSTFDDIGELRIPLASGAIKTSHVLGDFYDMCKLQYCREHDDDITVFKNGGGGHLDLMCARYIFDCFGHNKTS